MCPKLAARVRSKRHKGFEFAAAARVFGRYCGKREVPASLSRKVGTITYMSSNSTYVARGGCGFVRISTARARSPRRASVSSSKSRCR
jgi:hypothetical protein